MALGDGILHVFLGDPTPFACSGQCGEIEPMLFCQLPDRRRIVQFTVRGLVHGPDYDPADPVDHARRRRFAVESRQQCAHRNGFSFTHDDV